MTQSLAAREALQSILEDIQDNNLSDAETKLRHALAAPASEPVAYLYVLHDGERCLTFSAPSEYDNEISECVPLGPIAPSAAATPLIERHADILDAQRREAAFNEPDPYMRGYNEGVYNGMIVMCNCVDNPTERYPMFHRDAAARTEPYMHEDALPEMTTEAYDAWYAKSWLLDGGGVRVGPVVEPAREGGETPRTEMIMRHLTAITDDTSPIEFRSAAEDCMRDEVVKLEKELTDALRERERICETHKVIMKNADEHYEKLAAVTIADRKRAELAAAERDTAIELASTHEKALEIMCNTPEGGWQALYEYERNERCSCVRDGDDGTFRILCPQHEKQQEEAVEQLKARLKAVLAVPELTEAESQYPEHCIKTIKAIRHAARGS